MNEYTTPSGPSGRSEAEGEGANAPSPGTGKHTPGPWAVDQNGIVHKAISRWECVPLISPWIEDAFTSADDQDRDEALANSRLIAAAPDLLEALIALTEQFETAWSKQGISCSDVTRARAAIVKAIGGAA